MKKLNQMLNSINWKVRIKNKTFWITLIPAVLALAHKVLIMFGIDFDYTVISEELVEVVEELFLVLGILGIVVDPTTSGIKDSKLAMTYETPKED